MPDPIDYAALAAQARKTGGVDYAALADQARKPYVADSPLAHGVNAQEVGSEEGLLPRTIAALEPLAHPQAWGDIAGLLVPGEGGGGRLVSRLTSKVGDVVNQVPWRKIVPGTLGAIYGASTAPDSATPMQTLDRALRFGGGAAVGARLPGGAGIVNDIADYVATSHNLLTVEGRAARAADAAEALRPVRGTLVKPPPLGPARGEAFYQGETPTSPTAPRPPLGPARGEAFYQGETPTSPTAPRPPLGPARGEAFYQGETPTSPTAPRPPLGPARGEAFYQGETPVGPTAPRPPLGPGRPAEYFSGDTPAGTLGDFIETQEGTGAAAGPMYDAKGNRLSPDVEARARAQQARGQLRDPLLTPPAPILKTETDPAKSIDAFADMMGGKGPVIDASPTAADPAAVRQEVMDQLASPSDTIRAVRTSPSARPLPTDPARVAKIGQADQRINTALNLSPEHLAAAETNRLGRQATQGFDAAGVADLADQLTPDEKVEVGDLILTGRQRKYDAIRAVYAKRFKPDF